MDMFFTFCTLNGILYYYLESARLHSRCAVGIHVSHKYRSSIFCGINLWKSSGKLGEAVRTCTHNQWFEYNKLKKIMYEILIFTAK